MDSRPQGVRHRVTMRKTLVKTGEMNIRLITGASSSIVTGSRVYNDRMAAGLRKLGHGVEVVDAAGLRPEDAARPGCVPLVDGAALPGLAGANLDAATVLLHHPASLETNPPDEALRATEAALFREARHIVVTGEQTAARLLSDFGTPTEKISVIVPGIDDLPRSVGSSGATCEMLSVGQLTPRKGHDVLLRSLRRLFDLDWHLTIIGGANDPVHAHGLQALAEELSIAQRVEFAGEVTGDALETLWRNADLFALTPHFEGYGMAFAEAARRGLPVAATSTGAAPSLVGPDAGVVCAPGDVEQISRALRRLILDTSLRHEMAEVAWQSSRLLPSWDEQAARLAAVLST